MSSRFGDDPFAIRKPEETVTKLERFLKTHLEETGTRCLVVGMSGGLDSSVTAALCAKALGGQRVLGISLPEKETRNDKALEDAKSVASKYRVRFKIIDLTPIVEASRNTLDAKRARGVPWGNVKARLRAMVLYCFANVEQGLVVGTGDKSEIMLGYFTKFGDEEIVEETGLKLALVRKVRERWLKSEHKRRPPLAMKLGYRTAGDDLRLPRLE